ncbi:DNA polymerase III subunit [Metamycoplasma auris 15026]|uniref:DNA polymerase III subunit n=1 Tax=Metamycoplasma auris 15026 TaxID=1188233 RepID=N9VA97_9BACT|nr:DNA polymerase III subunit [Metamycoplasma auris]ENY68608.1 DNA polymerase III subunit [Metamycoplasma auris 15026]
MHFIFQKIINNSIKANKLGQFYLLSSKEEKNFDEYFLYFINQVNNENFKQISEINFGELYFFIDGKNQTILKQEVLEAMKNTTETSIFVPNKKKILIINNIENGTQQSLNSLLKFLENPPHNTIILSSCNFISQVINTIKSRALIIEIPNQKETLLLETNNNFYETFFSFINQDYDEELIVLLEKLKKAIFESHLKPYNLLRLIISDFLSENKEVFLNFSIFCFSLIYKLKKDINDSLWLKEFNLKKEMFDYIPIYKIINLFKEIKNALENAANFNLQKAKLLLKLEDFYGI